jgi:hypothetical protein
MRWDDTRSTIWVLICKEILVTDIQVTTNESLLDQRLIANCTYESPKNFCDWRFGCFDETVPICGHVLCIHCPGVTCGVVISVRRGRNERGDSQFVNGLHVIADETSAWHQFCCLVE